MRTYEISASDPSRLESTIGAARASAFGSRLSFATERLAGRRLVNVTADDRRKGGVYEILRSTLPYLRGAGVDVAWAVLSTDRDARPALEFFHVLAHGQPPSATWRSDLASRAAELSSFGLRGAHELQSFLRPSDLVVLHDTQTAPLAGALTHPRHSLVWHSHIGTADHNEMVAAYWGALGPSVAAAKAQVFYRAEFAPTAFQRSSTFASPGVDPSLSKSQPLQTGEARTLLEHPLGSWPLTWVAGSTPQAWDDHVVGLQLSRWDRLKDMPGACRVLCEIAHHDPSFTGLVAGPSAQSRAEQRQLDLTVASWEQASPVSRSRVHVGVIEQCGTEEHDQVVRVLQSAADVVLQKSLQEGFGLTVTEAMLRGKAVIASRVGGLTLQLQNGTNGILVDPDAPDAQWACQLRGLARNTQRRTALGTRAQADVLDHHVIDRQLVRLIDGLCPMLTCGPPK